MARGLLEDRPIDSADALAIWGICCRLRMRDGGLVKACLAG